LGDCILAPFWFYRANKHTNAHADTAKRLTYATVLGVSKYRRLT